MTDSSLQVPKNLQAFSASGTELILGRDAHIHTHTYFTYSQLLSAVLPPIGEITVILAIFMESAAQSFLLSTTYISSSKEDGAKNIQDKHLKV